MADGTLEHPSHCTCPSCLGTGLRPVDASGEGSGVYIPSGNTKPVWTTSQIVQQLVRSGALWGPVGTVHTITYSFYEAAPAYPNSAFPTTVDTYGSGETAGFSAFNAAQRAAAVVALQSWADVANVTFKYESDPNIAQISFANTTTGPGQAWTYYPGPTWLEYGDVWINPNQASNFQLSPGGYGLLTLVHEIGHALGLSHPGAYDASLGPVTYSGGAVYLQDSRMYTDMSYFSASYTGGYHTAYAASPLLDDIAAAQYLYGANMTTRTGDTVYGFNSNAGVDAFDFTKNAAPVIAIWDAGGFNTLDASGYSVAQIIDLNAGNFSSIGGLTYNVAIAYGVGMQGAVGGSGADTLIANALDDLLKGGAGNDTYKFGTAWGHDTVQDSGNLNTLSFTDGINRDSLTFAQSGSDLVIGRAGSGDTITVANYFSNPAAFQFVDANGAFAPGVGTPPPPPPPTNTAPVVIGGASVNRTLAEDAASFSLAIGKPTDADGDTLTVTITGLPANGTVKNGTTAVTNNQTLTVTQLTALTFTPNANFNGNAGSFSYTVSDGKGGSASQTVNLSVTAVNDAPVVTAKASAVKFAYGKSIAATSLFSAADVDGTITQYQIRDPSGVGSFKLSGGTLTTSNGWTVVTAAQLSQLSYVAGSRVGAETIQIKAYDGSTWSNTISISMSVTRTVSGGVQVTPAAVAPGGIGLENQPLALHEVTGVTGNGGAIWNDSDRDRRYSGWLAAHG